MIYLVGPDRAALTRNEGVEIVASSVIEASEKYETIDGSVGRDTEQYWDRSFWVRSPDGELTEVQADFDEIGVAGINDDDGVVTCPHCGELLHPDGTEA